MGGGVRNERQAQSSQTSNLLFVSDHSLGSIEPNLLREAIPALYGREPAESSDLRFAFVLPLNARFGPLHQPIVHAVHCKPSTARAISVFRRELFGDDSRIKSDFWNSK